jgi:hypothetical protein
VPACGKSAKTGGAGEERSQIRVTVHDDLGGAGSGSVGKEAEDELPVEEAAGENVGEAVGENIGATRAELKWRRTDMP